MSVRYLFADCNVVSIPAVSSAENGQALTVVDGAFQWITPGAGPAGPIQDVVSGNTQQITATKDDVSGVVTIEMPDSVYIDTLYIGNDSAEATSGYMLPTGNVDYNGNALDANADYALRYIPDAGAAAPASMKWAPVAATSSGVTTVVGAQGVTPTIATAGAVTIGLGDITPTTVTVGTGADIYKLPTSSAALTDSTKYVMQYAAASNQMTFTEETAGGAGVQSVESKAGTSIGTGIVVDNTDPANPVLDLGAIIPTSVNINDTYILPPNLSGANAGYVMKLPNPMPEGAPAQMIWAADSGTGSGTVTSVTEGTNIVVTGNASIDPTISLATSLTGLVDVATEALTVGTGAAIYKLPTTSAALTDSTKYVMQYAAASNQMTFAEETAGGAGVQSVTSKNDGTAGSGIVVINTDPANPFLELGNIVPESVNVKGEYILPESLPANPAGYALTLPNPMPTDGSTPVAVWAPVSGSGSGTVTSVTAGSNIQVTGNASVDPTISVNPVMTAITSISAGEFTTAATSTTNKTLINVNNALVIKSGSASTAGSDLSYIDRDSSSGFKQVNNVKGFQIITNEAGTIAPNPTVLAVGYILPTTQPTAVGQVLSVETLQTEVGPFTTTQWASPVSSGIDSVASSNANFITSSTTAGAVVLSLPSTMDISIPATEAAGGQIFKLGGLEATQTRTEAPNADTVHFVVNNSDRGLTVDDDGNVIIDIGPGQQYILPNNAPSVGPRFLQIDTPTSGISTCTWAEGTASGVNTIDGTTGQVTTTTAGLPVGTVKLGLDSALIVPSNAGGVASLTVGDCVISATISGDPLQTRTTLLLQNADVTAPENITGFKSDNTGTTILTADAGSYQFPTTSPNYGDIMQCTAVASGTTPANCQWSSGVYSTDSLGSATLIGYYMSASVGTIDFDASYIVPVNIGRFGIVKFIDLNLGVLSGLGGALCPSTATTEIDQIITTDLDITEKQYLAPKLINPGDEYTLGYVYYSITNKIGSEINAATESYGMCSVTLIYKDINTLVIKFILAPSATSALPPASSPATNPATLAIINNSYALKPGQRITFSSIAPMTVTPSTTAIPLNNHSPNGKCLFTYY